MNGAAAPEGDLAHLALNRDWSLSLHVSAGAVAIICLLFAAMILWRLLGTGRSFRDFEIDEAEFGIGDHKLKFKPNYADRQLAYAIWVELSTRKVGLKIDLEHDVIFQIYDSWHDFFSTTRELIKDIPVSRVNQDSTQKVIRLSIELLNEGLRPHLTKWQARFRRWYDRQLQNSSFDDLSPQEIQKKFPGFVDLETDITAVNKKLMAYRRKMNELVRAT